ncbi:D-amino acid dehydrogenase [Delftia lacustris]
MKSIAVIGAGVTGVTTAYALSKKGFKVDVFERCKYSAMETSYANGGQISVSNAEVWNSWPTVAKGMKWMLRKDAPFLFNPTLSIHKYSWIAEFLGQIRKYRGNTSETVRLCMLAREHLDSIVKEEDIRFDWEKRGILHLYADRGEFEGAKRANEIMVSAGLERFCVSPGEMRDIEPTLVGDFCGGLFTPSDSTGDVNKFTKELSKACVGRGVVFHYEVEVDYINTERNECVSMKYTTDGALAESRFDAVVVCAGVHSHAFARCFGDDLNIYPVKGYSITVDLDEESVDCAPMVGLVDDNAKVVTSRLGHGRFRVAGTAEFNGYNKDIRLDRIRPLIDWVERYFPGVNTSNVIPWAGLRPMTPNMLPKFGRGKHGRVFYNTGHGHLGWTLAPATADLTALAVIQEVGSNF